MSKSKSVELPSVKTKVLAWSPDHKCYFKCEVTKVFVNSFQANYRDDKGNTVKLTGLSKWQKPEAETKVFEAIAKPEQPEICENLTKTEEPENRETITEPEQPENRETIAEPEQSEIWDDLPKLEKEPKIWDDLPKLTQEWIDPALIIFDQGTQTRDYNNQTTINNYSERMIANDWDFERLPLPEFVFNGSNYFPVTGHHRALAAQKSELRIFGKIYQGDLDLAVYLSIRDCSNSDHGLPESQGDRRSRIEKFFNIFEKWDSQRQETELKSIDCFPSDMKKKYFTSWSNRAIACYLRIPFAYKQVETIRNKIELNKKIIKTYEKLETGKFYQWQIGEEIFTGKLIDAKDCEFCFDNKKIIYSWNPGILEFCDSVFEIDPPEILTSSPVSSPIPVSSPVNSPIPVSSPDNSGNSSGNSYPGDEILRNKSFSNLQNSCRRFSLLEDLENIKSSSLEVANVLDALSIWFSENDLDPFSENIDKLSEALKSSF
ncbi:MAG: hypothetical protein WB539_10635 [Planktothrix agardhii]|uniref:hypothetical protein n=1 Tax=Planktothrix agardhii TaxID=1160 RepID=UPI003C5B79EC